MRLSFYIVWRVWCVEEEWDEITQTTQNKAELVFHGGCSQCAPVGERFYMHSI